MGTGNGIAHETTSPVQCPVTGQALTRKKPQGSAGNPSAGSHVLSVTASFLHGWLRELRKARAAFPTDRSSRGRGGPTATHFPVCANERGLTSRPLLCRARARTQTAASFLSANFCAPAQGGSSQKKPSSRNRCGPPAAPALSLCPPKLPGLPALVRHAFVRTAPDKRQMQVQSFLSSVAGRGWECQRRRGKRWVSR